MVNFPQPRQCKYQKSIPFISSHDVYFRSVPRCLLLFLRMVLGMVYFGVALAAEDLGGELYRDYILQALVEFPAFAVSVYMCNRFVNP